MITDPIADFFTRIKNAYMAFRNTVVIPYSGGKFSLAQVLQKSGYVGKVDVKKDNSVKKFLKLDLLYVDKKPKISKIIMVSKPGKRVFVGYKDLPRVLGGLGIAIVSTPLGVMTATEAKKRRMGGELICKLW